MKLKYQVVNLELSKKLKELGVEQESVFYYEHFSRTAYQPASVDLRMSGESECLEGEEEAWYPDPESDTSAFTVAELGEMLPHMRHVFDSDGSRGWFHLEIKKYDGWKVRLRNESGVFYGNGEGDTEANARASFLISLLENKLITL